MKITLPLLGIVNPAAAKNAPLKTKYVTKVTAEQLAQFLQYERRGKRKGDLYRILSSSLIKIDPEIQRGLDPDGYHLQQPAKIADIAYCLLGDKHASMQRVYLSSLIWNVRSAGAFKKRKIEVEGMPAEWELQIETDEIFLTDSAHRHFGIVEAYRAYRNAPDSYPNFSPSLEFLVEIHNLDRTGEKELFSELNSKQKKISAAKQKELDVSSPIGALKDAIVEYDRTHQKLFVNNIEVTSNTNEKHTLMTMSVFVASIGEMFTTEEIKDARSDEDLREMLAEFYCNFSYELSSTIVVRCDLDGSGQPSDVHPFANLYLELIKAVEDRYDEQNPVKSERDLDDAQQEAIRRNKVLRRCDIANNNATIKALYRLGGKIRRMQDWPTVIRRLQTALVAPSGGKFFQRENAELFAKESDSDIPIASLNEKGDGINVQVQTKNINKLHNYLWAKLGLPLSPAVVVLNGDEEIELSPDRTGSSLSLDTQTETVVTLELRGIGLKGLPLNESDVTLAVVPSIEWKEATRKAAKQLSPIHIFEDRSYEDPYYPDLTRWIATFEVKLPPAAKVNTRNFEISFEFSHPNIADRREKTTRAIAFSVT